MHWWPWGEGAWEQAKAANKLVIVSIGYSACHWCHVMERETFEDEEAADFMNAHFVSIKVDREERPDVDQVYMSAVQLMTQQGGWPLHCVTLPDGRPIWGGTYFKKGHWMQALERLNHLHDCSPQEMENYAAQLTEAVQSLEAASSPPSPWPNAQTAEEDLSAQLKVVGHQMVRSVRSWANHWDPIFGGTTGSPKFVLPVQLDFLDRWADVALWLEKTATLAEGLAQPGSNADTDMESAAIEHLTKTLRAVERGGLHDHVSGGFARYSVDGRWHVPHFEKMLYDNAQLLGTYALAWKRDKHPALAHAVRRTAHFLMQDMSPSESGVRHGGFMSALDADTAGEEGRFYVWTDDDLRLALPDTTERELVRDHFGMGAGSIWERDKNVLMRQKGVERAFWESEAMQSALGKALQRMADWRNGQGMGKGRIPPRVDDKVVVGWTALAVSGLAKAGMAMAEPSWIERAKQGATFLTRQGRMTSDAMLLRRSWHANGGPETEGYSEDYALTIEAFLDLHQATLDGRWREEARALMATTLDRFWDDEANAFWYMSRDAEQLFSKSIQRHDGVIPSANATLAGCLWKLGWACEIPIWRDLSRQLVRQHLGQASFSIAESGKWGQVWIDQTLDFGTVVVCASSESGVQHAWKAWNARRRPGTWLEAVWPNATHIPSWMEDKAIPREGETTWYVCREGTCSRPLASAEEAWQQWSAWQIHQGDRRIGGRL